MYKWPLGYAVISCLPQFFRGKLRNNSFTFANEPTISKMSTGSKFYIKTLLNPGVEKNTFYPGFTFM